MEQIAVAILQQEQNGYIKTEIRIDGSEVRMGLSIICEGHVEPKIILWFESQCGNRKSYWPSPVS
jgi:hypothetical protein